MAETPGWVVTIGYSQSRARDFSPLQARLKSTMADPDSLYQTYLSLRAGLARAVRRIVPPKDVDDIVQETYLRVCQLVATKNIRTPRSFLFTTARNLALDHVKSAEFRLCVSPEDSEDRQGPGIDDPGDETFHLVASNEEFARFCEAVRNLPMQCRRAFVLRKVYGYSQRQIARQMRLSESTVEKHIAEGIRRCRQHLLQGSESLKTPGESATESRSSTTKGRE